MARLSRKLYVDAYYRCGPVAWSPVASRERCIAVEQQTYLITFDNVSAAEANRYAEELRHFILAASPDVTVQRQRDDPQAQDFGATLVLLLGTPAAGAIIKAIGDWLALRNRASLSIRRDGETLALKNITSAKAAELAQLLLNREQPVARGSVQAPSPTPTPSPQTTLLILLGASTWSFFPEFQSSEAFARAARNVKNYFLNPWFFGLPAANLLDLFDADETADRLDMAIGEFLEQRQAALRAAGSAGRDLLFYFIGHGGFIGRDSDFYLAVRRTRAESPRASGMQMMALADTLTRQASHLRRYLILDCCFAGAAFSAFQGAPDQVALQKTSDAFGVKRKTVGFPTRGTALLCSSSHTSPSLLLPDGSSTMFTRAILDALIQEAPAWGGALSLRDVKDITATLLSEIRNAPRPVVLSPDQSEGDVADIPLFPHPGVANRPPEEAMLRSTGRAVASQADQEKAKEEMYEARVPVAKTSLPVQTGQSYLNAAILGVFLSLLSMFFLQLLPVWAGADPEPTPLQGLPSLVLSLVAGILLGKRQEALAASLLAGLIIGLSGFFFMMLKYSLNGMLQAFPPEAWLLLTSVTVISGPLCWLAAWIRTHTSPL